MSQAVPDLDQSVGHLFEPISPIALQQEHGVRPPEIADGPGLEDRGVGARGIRGASGAAVPRQGRTGGSGSSHAAESVVQASS